jgi:hypothetical protein
MEEVGLRDVHYRRLALGSVTLHVGERAPQRLTATHRIDQSGDQQREMVTSAAQGLSGNARLHAIQTERDEWSA